MEHIGHIARLSLPGFEPVAKAARRGPRNERDEYLDYFFARLAPLWKSRDGKPLTKRYVAIRISHLKRIQDLHYLKNICLDGEQRGKAFSFVFWGSLKPKPDDIVLSQ